MACELTENMLTVEVGQTYCAESREHIASSTGFRVDIVHKKHYALMEMIRQWPVQGNHDDVPRELLAAGNCILVALGHLFGKWNELVQFSQEHSAANAACETVRVRSYRSCTHVLRLHFSPILDFGR